MTMPDLAAVATAPAVADTAAVAAASAPFFDPNRPPLSLVPDAPRMPRMPLQAINFAQTLTILRDFYRARPDVLVMGEGYLRDVPGITKGSLYPDCMVAFNLPYPADEIDAANGYTISELGKPPDFILEIGSLSTGRNDYTTKREVYARQQVPEYWRFDHTGGRFHDAALAGDRLTAEGVYEPIRVERTPEGLYRGYSTVLDLELRWVASRLRFWNPNTGDYVPDIADNRVGREAEAAGRRAAEAAQRAAEAAQLATADQLDAAIIDRDANAAAHQAETAAHQATQAQLANAQQLIAQLQAQLNHQQ